MTSVEDISQQQMLEEFQDFIFIDQMTLRIQYGYSQLRCFKTNT